MLSKETWFYKDKHISEVSRDVISIRKEIDLEWENNWQLAQETTW